ncbi:MAG: AraC family transcriptional regulator [Prevotellaceae bacterium]|jgi:AraC-like DNA-binding protein|nr:AraC family transcriptional regulator [Prevotellaceae bacterium]
MKPTLRSITSNPQASFSVRKDVGANVYSNWHHHSDIELLVIRGGRGVQTIGDRTDNLNESSHMTLIGPFLPHTMSYDSRPGEKIVEAIVVHFKQALFGSEWLNLPEMKPLQKLFSNIAYGLNIKGRTLAELEPRMFELYAADYFDRFFILLDILRVIARRKQDCEPIAGKGFVGHFSPQDNKRLDKIYQYTFAHYGESVNLAALAALTGFSREAFCRYFKQQTGKTYIEFLTEVRIGHACRLLMQQEMDVMEISYACGYNYASNFYRQFKQIKGVTPLQYRRAYQNMLQE